MEMLLKGLALAQETNTQLLTKMSAIETAMEKNQVRFELYKKWIFKLLFQEKQKVMDF